MFLSDMPVPEKQSAMSRRSAWVIVIIMSALFVLALLGVIWGFVKQSRILMAHRAPAPVTAVSPGGAAAAVVLAPGSRIISASTDSGKLVLHVATPTGGEVEVIDLATGRLTGQVKTH
jgi:hypothetical protein